MEFFSRGWRAGERKVHGTTGKNKERTGPESRDQRRKDSPCAEVARRVITDAALALDASSTKSLFSLY